MAAVTTYDLTGNAHIDGLLSDGVTTVPGPTSSAPSFDLASIITQLRTSWGGQQENDTYPLYGTNVQYAILTSAPLDATSPEDSGWQAMSALMVARAAEAFESWDDLIAINLTQYTGNPPSGASVIQFGYSSTTQNGGTYEFPELGYYQGTNSFGGDAWAITRAEIWMNSTWSTHSTSSVINQSGYGYYGGYGFITYMHEIGHAMGLSHPGSYNGSATYAADAEYLQDTRRYTIMSYFDAGEDGSGTDHYGSDGQWKYAQTPMLHDIAAAQAIYGADTTTRAANTTYGFNSTAGKDVYDFTKNTNPIITIYDAGGTDTLDLSGFGGGQYGGQVINLTAGSWSSVGGYMTNNLSIAYGTVIESAIGGTGNDTIRGNDGTNTLWGGLGSDTLFGMGGTDHLLGGDGNDYVYGEQGYDTLEGGAGNDSMAGGVWDDRLLGNEDDDVLWGEAGHDTLIGGTGHDILFGQDDIDTLFGEAGDDMLYGGSGDDTLAGQVGNDALSGEAGNDFLYGGEGQDTIFGGLGADSFYFFALPEGVNTIYDVNRSEGDRFVIQGSGFSMPAGFGLTAGKGFLYGDAVAPVEATATFYFATVTNYLWFDPDGTGPSGGTLVAFLTNQPLLTASDFWIV